ncbi:MAG: hypothetical protein WHU10_00195 [Fimbriimonadales bacterium]
MGSRKRRGILAATSMEAVRLLPEWLPKWPSMAMELGVCAACGRRTVGERYCGHLCNRRFWMLVRDLEYAAGVRERKRCAKPRDPDGDAMRSKRHPGAPRFLAPPRWMSAAPDNPRAVLGSWALPRRHGVGTGCPAKHMVVGLSCGVLSVPPYRLVVPHRSVAADILMAVGWNRAWRMPDDAAEAYRELERRAERGRHR